MPAQKQEWKPCYIGENKTTRMLLLHQLANEDTDFTPEFYYLHLEPK
ncbi:MAG: hypothetical protein L6U16_07010 [Porphyromonadaceae bacterium]|nr:MAG: hypothetical protein L6U16_07010 [Porphyromonadaceae bacterium]